MTHMTDEQIEGAFLQVREKFEKTENAFGLEMLDSIEDRWEALGELSDKQLAWLDRQLNQSWKRKKAKATSAPLVGSSILTNTQPVSPDDHQLMPPETLNHLIAALDAMKEALISLQRPTT